MTRKTPITIPGDPPDLGAALSRLADSANNLAAVWLLSLCCAESKASKRHIEDVIPVCAEAMVELRKALKGKL